MTEIIPGGTTSASSADLLIVPVFADLTWGPGAESAADQLGPWLTDYLETREFTGATSQIVVVPGGALAFGTIAFVGLGDEADAEVLRRAAGSVGRLAAPYASAATTLHLVDVEGAIGAVTLGYLLGAYRFDAYRSEPKQRVNERLELLEAIEGTTDEIQDATAIARGVMLARDLINRPAADKSPVVLAERARSLGSEISVEIVDEVEAAERGYGGLLAVGAGSTNPPRMVIMRYEPADAQPFVAFVGKGIVFDSGGLSLKPAKGMEDMKTDMAGAAAVWPFRKGRPFSVPGTGGQTGADPDLDRGVQPTGVPSRRRSGRWVHVRRQGVGSVRRTGGLAPRSRRTGPLTRRLRPRIPRAPGADDR